MDAKKTAQQVLEQVGGAENVTFLTHCVTRLRFNLKSMDGVDEAKVKAVPGVVGVVNKGGQYQVIIGNEVAAVYDELMKLGDFGGKEVKQPAAPAEEKKSRVSIILDTLAGVFTPLMPLIAGAGMIKALLSVLTLFGWIDKSGNLYYFLNFIADSSYYFLPIFLANSAAKKFGCNPQMAMLLGAILLHPNFIALKADADVVHVLGLPVKMVTYSSSVIPIFLITLVLPYVERFVNKVVPSVVKFILRPVLTILIMAPISLCVLGPLGSIIGDGLVNVLLAIEKVCPWALPTVIGAFMPFLVMTGMHYSLLPAYVNSLSMLGYETVIGPGNLPSNIAQGAAALCVAIKTKNKNFRQLAVSGGVTALLGVTEPALFGVNVRLRKPLIATTIGGGLGGLYAGLTGVRRFGGGGAGLAAIGLYVGENPMNVINALISSETSSAGTILPFRRCFLRLSQQLCTAGVYSGEYLPQPLDLGTRVVPQGQQTGVRQRQLQRQVPCRRKGRVFHRAQKHAAPGKQIVVNTLVVFHHVPAWCGKRQAGLNNGKIHHFLIQRLIKQLLPGKIGQRQSAAPCERVLR